MATGLAMRSVWAVATAAVISAAAALAAPPASAEPPWAAAERVRTGLFDAQTSLLLADGRATAGVARARRALAGELERGLRVHAPDSLRALRDGIAAARRALAQGDEVGVAAARGRAIAELRLGAYAVTLAAVRRGDAAEARRWLLVRDFRQATRFTRPGVDATAALDALAAGETTSAAAVTAVKKDLLDAYQARLLGYLDLAEQARKRGFRSALAERTAIAAGYWRILAPEYERQRGTAARQSADGMFRALARAALARDGAAVDRGRRSALAAVDGFVAAPLAADEQARRAAQLLRFLDLVPIEYDDGTDDGRVTIPFELQEAVAFVDGAQSALDDLKAVLEQRDAAGVATVESAFAELERYARDAHEGRAVVSVDDVEEAHDQARDALDRLFPGKWKETDTEADFDLIENSLDQMQAAASAGEKKQAEQARLTAYAFFEFGPELQLRALDPQLVAEVEGLVWYGARGEEGLAELIAGESSSRELRETRLVLDEALEEAKAVTGEGASDATMITNAALIVFREGLEAILIIAAITASMVGGNRPLRRPIYHGALLALPVSVGLWVLAQTVLDSLSRYGEKLEAVVGLVAIGVLLLVLNWFFHRVYWTEWIAGHRRRGKAIAGAAAGGATAATVAGLYLLGFSSVLREGFETVLFLQALELNAGAGVVLAGVALGLVLTAVVGVATFALERRLPYKRMLIVTGVLIALVLMVVVGNTARTLQGIGWIPITPLDVELPLWMGTWLGVFPTVETLGAQLGALGFVVGSYFLAERVRTRGVRRSGGEDARRVGAGGRSGHREHDGRGEIVERLAAASRPQIQGDVDRERRERGEAAAQSDRQGPPAGRSACHRGAAD